MSLDDELVSGDMVRFLGFVSRIYKRPFGEVADVYVRFLVKGNEAYERGVRRGVESVDPYGEGVALHKTLRLYRINKIRESRL